MKRTITTGLAAIILSIVFTAVGAAQDKKVGVMWEGKAGMAKRVFMGFSSKVRELAPNLHIATKIEIRDMAEAETVFREFETQTNGVVFLRSSGAEFLAKVDPKVPCFIGGCNNPIYLGTIKDLQAPEGKITGVSYFVPYEKRFEAIKALFPQAKSVALLAQKGHPATPIDQDGTREQCKRLGIVYNEVVATNSAELLKETEKLVGKVDVFIISSTGLAIDNAVSIVGISNRSKVPVFSYAEGRAQLGATAELAADDAKLGAMLAESVVDVIVKNKPIRQVPIKFDNQPKLIVNESSVKNLGIQLPASLLEKVEMVR